jgi:D-erythrulose 1-phosphate 3-epimerase
MTADVTGFPLGVNTCFAVKRWPEPAAWAEIVARRLGIRLVQHSLDLVNLDVPRGTRDAQARAVRDACERYGLRLDSTFTGLAAYSSNLLLHPDPALRRHAERWFGRAIRFTVEAGGTATGGHVGAYSVAAWRRAEERADLEDDLRAALRRLSAAARREGLRTLVVENLASAREPSTMVGIERLLSDGDGRHVPVRLCLDVGHQCVPGTTGDDRDPYAWLRRMGGRAAMVQLQQSDDAADHHWPFTPERNAAGRIDADRVLDALEASGARGLPLFLEVIPPFEQDDDEVLEEMEASASYWQEALARRGG